MPIIVPPRIVDPVAVRKKLDEMRRRPVEPDPSLLSPDVLYRADEELRLFSEMEPYVEKALPGGVKLWHLLVALGVLVLLRKR